MAEEKSKESGSGIKNASPPPSKDSSTDSKSNLPQRFLVLAIGLIAAIWQNWDNPHNLFGNGGSPTEQVFAKVPKDTSRIKLEGRKLYVADESVVDEEVILMEIPRSMQIWELDAIRNSFVRENLFTKEFGYLTPFMAAYLALLRVYDDMAAPDFHKTYAKSLPTYEDYASFHPALADLNYLAKLLGGTHTYSFFAVQKSQDAHQREYDILVDRSEEFSNLVSRKDYLAARLAIDTRMFSGVGKVPNEEVLPGVNFDLDKEIEYYKHKINVDINMHGGRMIPIQDLVDHHFQGQNVMYSGIYDEEKGSTLVLRSKKAIPKGGELISFYQAKSDAELFATYGFCPFDGSGPTVAILHAHHDSGASSGESKPSDFLPYLQYDYGYEECIDQNNFPEAYDLKAKKAAIIMVLATDLALWQIPMIERRQSKEDIISPTILPEDYKLPSFDDELLESHIDYWFEYQPPLPCMYVALTLDDFNGKAADVVAADLDSIASISTRPFPKSKTFDLELMKQPSTSSWKARTMACVRHLARAQKQKYSTTATEQETLLSEMVEKDEIFTLEWNAAHVTLGELQTLEAVERYAMKKQKVYEEEEGEDFTIREEAC